MKVDGIEKVFSDIYKNNSWARPEYAVARGEKPLEHKLMDDLPIFLHELGITSLLDCPCGAFQWMMKIDLTGIDYLGGDIVTELIEKNKVYETKTIKFKRIDLLTDNLPKADLILCRDCLVHLTLDEAVAALKNIINSDIKYLLATTFTERSVNVDIPTGGWRPLNLEIHPFNLGKPDKVMCEEVIECDKEFKDKALGLWDITDLRNRMIK